MRHQKNADALKLLGHVHRHPPPLLPLEAAATMDGRTVGDRAPLASGVVLTCRSPLRSSSSSLLMSIKLDVKVSVTVFKKTLTLAQLVHSRSKTLEIVRVWGSKKNRWSSSLLAREQAAQG